MGESLSARAAGSVVPGSNPGGGRPTHELFSQFMTYVRLRNVHESGFPVALCIGSEVNTHFGAWEMLRHWPTACNRNTTYLLKISILHEYVLYSSGSQ
jgi:hypothetical protein